MRGFSGWAELARMASLLATPRSPHPALRATFSPHGEKERRRRRVVHNRDAGGPGRASPLPQRANHAHEHLARLVASLSHQRFQAGPDRPTPASRDAIRAISGAGASASRRWRGSGALSWCRSLHNRQAAPRRVGIGSAIARRLAPSALSASPVLAPATRRASAANQLQRLGDELDIDEAAGRELQIPEALGRALALHARAHLRRLAPASRLRSRGAQSAAREIAAARAPSAASPATGRSRVSACNSQVQASSS